MSGTNELIFNENSLIVVDNSLNSQENLANALISFGVEALISEFNFATPTVLIPVAQDDNPALPNTSVSVTVNAVTGEWANKTFLYHYRRMAVADFTLSIPGYSAGCYIPEGNQDTYEKKLEFIKAILTLSGVRIEDLDITIKDESSDNSVTGFSNVNKVINIKAKSDSLIYVGEFNIPFIATGVENTDDDTDIEELKRKIKELKEKEEEARQRRIAAENQKRKEQLEKLKADDAEAAGNVTTNPGIGAGNGKINPGEWTGDFADISPPGDDTPVPPPAIPDLDDTPTPPTPPKNDTPPPLKTKAIRLGSLVNHHEVVKSHLMINPNGSQKKQVEELKKLDIHLDKPKVNPDNHYLYAGVSHAVQGMNLTEIIDTEQTRK